MAGLFAAEFDVFFIHSVSDVGVADGGDFEVDALFLGPVEEALVNHDGGDNSV